MSFLFDLPIPHPLLLPCVHYECKQPWVQTVMSDVNGHALGNYWTDDVSAGAAFLSSAPRPLMHCLTASLLRWSVANVQPSASQTNVLDMIGRALDRKNDDISESIVCLTLALPPRAKLQRNAKTFLQPFARGAAYGSEC